MNPALLVWDPFSVAKNHNCCGKVKSMLIRHLKKLESFIYSNKHKLYHTTFYKNQPFNHTMKTNFKNTHSQHIVNEVFALLFNIYTLHLEWFRNKLNAAVHRRRRGLRPPTAGITMPLRTSSFHNSSQGRWRLQH